MSDDMNVWRPIATAPKDGTVVLLRGKHDKCADGFWRDETFKVYSGFWVWPYIKCNPTHWMPLPKLHESHTGD